MLRNAACIALLALGAGARADVVATGEFAGQDYETFEAVGTPGGYPGAMPIFGGAATVADSLANTVVIAFNWFGPAGEVLPYGGNLMGGTPAGTTVFTFDEAVTDFGGYFNTVADVGGGSAVFRDEDGFAVATLSFDLTPTEWTWLGWHSDAGFTTVELTGNAGGGFGFQFDNLTYNSVPGPGAGAFVAIAGLCAARRRRG